jgi:hypothetical protein
MQLIIPLAAIQIIGLCVIITVNVVIAGTAKQAIVSLTAQQRVIAIIAVQGVISQPTRNVVIPLAPCRGIIATARDQCVIAKATI